MTLELIVAYPDAYAFVEPDPKEQNKKRLTISGHGDKKGVMIGGIHYEEPEIARFIRTWTVGIANLHSVRIVCCNSADPDMKVSSLAMQLSKRFPTILIEGYVHKVTASCGFSDVYNIFRTHGSRAAEYGLNRYFSIFKDDPLYHFHSVVFLNGAQVDQAQTINGYDFVTLGYDGKTQPCNVFK
ncbi:hypothetical protein FE392_17830 [Xenorhabdus sp. 12]|uniref:Uncharacterized protein n=1 Tax=Xenorhabdus santafensis TaxID=2582833 RepID=A0ABU4SEC3_9GAMM|nr:hypothetical protein [Xenorhabdus sp. 12]MDX7989147.1 hypothetical protein [Xenorhabdus sp. 12]